MKLRPKFSIAEHFETVEDPRIERSKAHLLIDILNIAILAVICGANGWIRCVCPRGSLSPNRQVFPLTLE